MKLCSPIQVRAQALENTTRRLGLSVIFFFTCIVLVLSRLKVISASLVTGMGEGATNVDKLVLERARSILLRRSMKFRRYLLTQFDIYLGRENCQHDIRLADL